MNAIKIDLNLLSPRKSVEKWGVGFIKLLISLTHKQWIYRNSNVHHRIEGLTLSVPLILCNKIQVIMRTNPADLLPCDRHLLTQDFHSLGSSATIQPQIWVASMESALSAAAQVALSCFTLGSLAIFNETPLLPHTCRLSNNSQHTVHNQLPAPRRPRQQTLPASFWAPT